MKTKEQLYYISMDDRTEKEKWLDEIIQLLKYSNMYLTPIDEFYNNMHLMYKMSLPSPREFAELILKS